MKGDKKDGKRVVLPPNRAHTEMVVGNFNPIRGATNNQHGDCCGSFLATAPEKKEEEKSKK